MTQYDPSGKVISEDQSWAEIPGTHTGADDIRPASVWPPSPTGGTSPIGTHQDENTSGMDTAVPYRISDLRWNWGAFFLGMFWAAYNGAPVWSLALVATMILKFGIQIWRHDLQLLSVGLFGVQLGISIYLGAMGHALSWRKRRYADGIDQFFSVQKTWTKAGFWCFGLSFLIMPIIFIILLGPAVLSIMRTFSN